MEVQTVAQPNVLLDHRAVEAQIGVLNTAGLSLRTREGDVVNLSYSNEFNFAGSQSETTTAEGAVHQEISTVAQAASRYSLSVQGDLNEDELKAIQALAEGIEPVARDFFTSGEFDLEAATGTLVASLDQLQEVELRLERVVSAALGVRQTQVRGPEQVPTEAPKLKAHGLNAEELLNPQPAAPASFNFPRIRDINELVKSVIDTEFPARAVEVVGDKAIARSLREFMDFIKERLTGFLGETEPAPPESAPATEPADVQDFVEV